MYLHCVDFVGEGSKVVLGRVDFLVNAFVNSLVLVVDGLGEKLDARVEQLKVVVVCLVVGLLTVGFDKIYY